VSLDEISRSMELLSYKTLNNQINQMIFNDM